VPPPSLKLKRCLGCSYGDKRRNREQFYFVQPAAASWLPWTHAGLTRVLLVIARPGTDLPRTGNHFTSRPGRPQAGIGRFLHGLKTLSRDQMSAHKCSAAGPAMA